MNTRSICHDSMKDAQNYQIKETIQIPLDKESKEKKWE
jgi:hypothetical protein